MIAVVFPLVKLPTRRSFDLVDLLLGKYSGPASNLYPSEILTKSRVFFFCYRFSPRDFLFWPIDFFQMANFNSRTRIKGLLRVAVQKGSGFPANSFIKTYVLLLHWGGAAPLKFLESGRRTSEKFG